MRLLTVSWHHDSWSDLNRDFRGAMLPEGPDCQNANVSYGARDDYGRSHEVHRRASSSAEPASASIKGASDWFRLVLGLFLVFGLFHASATILGSDRGQARDSDRRVGRGRNGGGRVVSAAPAARRDGPAPWSWPARPAGGHCRSGRRCVPPPGLRRCCSRVRGELMPSLYPGWISFYTRA